MEENKQSFHLNNLVLFITLIALIYIKEELLIIIISGFFILNYAIYKSLKNLDKQQMEEDEKLMEKAGFEIKNDHK